MAEEVIESDLSQEQTTKRPIVITVICVLGFLGALINIPLIFSGSTATLASWHPLYLAGTTVVALICLVGLWKMKKWAAYLYVAMQIISIAVMSNMDLLKMPSFVFSVVLMVIILSQLKKMR